LLNSFGNPHSRIMSIYQCCYGCLRIVGTSQQLGNLGSVQHRRCQRVESCIVSTIRETDESETLMSPSSIPHWWCSKQAPKRELCSAKVSFFFMFFSLGMSLLSASAF
jgi:hypothetical protein